MHDCNFTYIIVKMAIIYFALGGDLSKMVVMSSQLVSVLFDY